MKKTDHKRWQAKLLLFVLFGAAGLLYLSFSPLGASNWSWEEQLAMEAAMMQAANQSPGSIPEIDRQIPETETALFALG